MDETNQSAVQTNVAQPEIRTKFCKHCGGTIPEDTVLCTLCGRQVDAVANANGASQPQIVINNANTNTNVSNGQGGRAKSKWAALLPCFFFGAIGAHKFYEGKIGMGILYFFTGGLFLIGVIVDFTRLLFRSNPYYV